MKLSIIHYICIIAGVELDAYIDHKLIKEKKNVHTFMQYAIRLAVFVFLSYTFSRMLNDIQYMWYSLILTFFVYWWLFDVSINAWRGLPLGYLSDKGIDGFQRPFIKEAFFLKLVFFICASLYFFKPELYYI
jgi:hypothetical protein